MTDDEFNKHFEVIQNEILAMKMTLDNIRETLVKADTTITNVSAQVMPTLDSLMKSPMLKMLMPKGGK